MIQRQAQTGGQGGPNKSSLLNRQQQQQVDVITRREQNPYSKQTGAPVHAKHGC